MSLIKGKKCNVNRKLVGVMGTPRGLPAAGVAGPGDHRGWNKGSYRRGIFIARRERNVNQVLVRLCVKMKRTRGMELETVAGLPWIGSVVV